MIIKLVYLVWQFVVGLGEKVSPTDIEEGMRVGYVVLIFRFVIWVRYFC